MTPPDYRDILWVVLPHEDEKLFTVRSFTDEAALYEMTEKECIAGAYTVSLPLEELVGSRKSKTRWTQRRVSAEEAAAVGLKLRESLPSELLKVFDEPSDRTLRVKIYSPSQRVTDMPWEWLADEQGVPLALRPDVRLVRSVPVRFETPPLTVTSPIKVLLVLTNPKDERLLDAWAERDAVCQELLDRPEYSLLVCPEPTAEVLQHTLHDFVPHVVHYIGHAGIDGGEGNIILHDEGRRTYWMRASYLARLLPPTVRLLCLSTCFSVPNYQILGLPQLAHAPAELNLPTVLVNRYPVGQESVRAFWKAFYPALIKNQGNVNEAAHEARLACRNAVSHSADWASFSLVLRDRTGQGMNILKAGSRAVEEVQAEELQAQFAARLANELAQHVRLFDGLVSEGLRETFANEMKRAEDLLNHVNNITANLKE